MKKIKKRKATIIKKNKTINTKPQNKKRNKIQNNSKKIIIGFLFFIFFILSLRSLLIKHLAAGRRKSKFFH